MWPLSRAKKVLISTNVISVVAAVLFALSFGTNNWLTFPPGHFYLETHSLSMGLWSDRACVDGDCGMVSGTEIRKSMASSWGLVLGLMCTTLSLLFIAVCLTFVTLVYPRRVFSVLASISWFCTAAMNTVAVVLFWLRFETYGSRMSWSLWVAMIANILFYLLGFLVAIFSCCHRWYLMSSATDQSEAPAQVAPPPVVSYRGEATTSDGKPYDFTTDPDMQPYSFGGKAYNAESDRSGGGDKTAQSNNM